MRNRQRGFTLVELVVAITITTIIVGFVALFMTAPVDAYMDQSERTRLNESAQLISRSMEEDLRSALPNSVRISTSGTRTIVEMLRVEAVSFYRSAGELGGATAREMEFPATDNQFSLFGRTAAAANGRYLVVGNLGTGHAGRDAYQVVANGVIVPIAATTITPNAVTLEDRVTLNTPFRFPAPDARNRLFVVSWPVTYICNTAARTVRRFDRYPIGANIPASEIDGRFSAVGATDTTLADNVAACRLTCGGVNTTDVCPDTLVAAITVDRPTADGNESIRLLEQFSVDNL
jgi:MSHA biogenesis protein MshO